jgi:hypothetical protein
MRCLVWCGLGGGVLNGLSDPLFLFLAVFAWSSDEHGAARARCRLLSTVGGMVRGGGRGGGRQGGER